uniref:Uncharacterized protein n=1 Tax=Xiphophorus couchianus TaxID=32473 RepID=A0A3B5KU81_9TELE
ILFSHLQATHTHPFSSEDPINGCCYSLYCNTDSKENGLCISYLLLCSPAVDCIMSPWTAWSGCSVTCGLGSLFRQRDILRDALPGGSCGGGSRLLDTVFLLPVHGHWSAWTEWSECDALCGGGVRQRSRTCSAPPPKNGGRECEGMTRQSQTCNIQPCTLRWSDWTDCSKSCGGGIQSRRRLCDSPSPEGAGNYCEGLGTEVRACNTDHCPGSLEDLGS